MIIGFDVTESVRLWALPVNEHIVVGSLSSFRSLPSLLDFRGFFVDQTHKVHPVTTVVLITRLPCALSLRSVASVIAFASLSAASKTPKFFRSTLSSKSAILLRPHYIEVGFAESALNQGSEELHIKVVYHFEKQSARSVALVEDIRQLAVTSGQLHPLEDGHIGLAMLALKYVISFRSMQFERVVPTPFTKHA